MNKRMFYNKTKAANIHFNTIIFLAQLYKPVLLSKSEGIFISLLIKYLPAIEILKKCGIINKNLDFL